MSQLITRSNRVDLEIRNDGTGRTVCGIACPFNSPAEIRGYEGEFTETVVPGAFQATLRDRISRVKFLGHHDARSNPLGVATLLREDAAGLYGEFKLSKTTAADEVLELVRDGAIDGLSIGFRALKEQWSRDRKQRTLTSISLREVSATAFPAYVGASITGVRAAESLHLSTDMAERRLRILDW